jgi:protein O-mannosyl-transferase
MMLSHNCSLVTLLLATFLLFCPVGNYGFISYDDNINVTENPLLDPPGLYNLGRIWDESYHHMYIPVSYSVWMGVTALSRSFEGPALSARLFHWLNLSLHLANIALVFLILSIVTENTFGALTGSLLFALHPLQVESVAWVTCLRDQLAAFLCLLSLWLYFSPIHKRKTWLPAVCTAIFVLAMLSKPSAIALPFILIILGRLVFAEPWMKMAPMALTWIAFGVPLLFFTKHLQPDLIAGVVPPWISRPVVAFDALGFYLEKILYPSNLAWDYGRLPELMIHDPRAIFSSLLTIIAAIGIVISKDRLLWAGSLIFVVALFPVLGFVPFEFQQLSTVADHYVYFAMLGLVLIAARLSSRLYASIPQLRMRLPILLCIALGTVSRHQLHFWQNDGTLFSHNLAANPLSPTARNNLGLYLIATGDFAGAEACFKNGIELSSNSPQQGILLNRWLWGLGLVYVKSNETAKALDVLKRLASSQSEYQFQAILSLANLSEKASDYSEAARQYAEAVNLKPNDAFLWRKYGESLVHLKQWKQAEDAFKNAIRRSSPSHTPELLESLRDIERKI